METAKVAEVGRQTNAATKEAGLAAIEGDAKKVLAALDRSGGQIIENADRSTRFAAIAERYAGLDMAGRARTLVIEPSREGRDALTTDIRGALTKSGALTGPAVAVESLANTGLPRAEARAPMSYDKGDVRSEEHTSELPSLMSISYAVFCLKKKKKTNIQSKPNK